MVILEQLAVYGVGEIFLLYLMDVLDFTRQDNITLLLFAGVLSCIGMLLILPLLNHALAEKRLIMLCIILIYIILHCIFIY